MTVSRRFWTGVASTVLVSGTALLSLEAKPPSRIEVLSRARVGGYGEDLAFVASGPLAQHIAFVDGYDILGIPGQAIGKPKARKLFDLYALDPVPRATGIAYVESRKQFVVNDSGPSNFFFVDHQGQPRGGASMVFPLPDGYTPSYIEGLGYIPQSAGQFADHLVMAAQNANGTSDLLFADLQGNVVKHVAPACYDQASQPLAGFGSVAYLPGDRLILTMWSPAALCIVDFNGVAAAPVTLVDSPSAGEGVTRLADGRIVMLEFPQNLLFFDADLNRLPGDDRHDALGPGLSLVGRGLAWDPATARHLLSYTEPGFGVPTAIADLTPDLDAATKVVDLTNWPGYTPGNVLTTQGMTHVGPEGRIGIATIGRGAVRPVAGAATLPYLRGLLLWDGASGNLDDQIDLCVPSAPSPPSTCTLNYGSLQPTSAWGRASRVAYIPGATPADARFAVRFNVGVPASHPGTADNWTAYLFDRAGNPTGSIDLAATAGLSSLQALEYVGPADGTAGRLALIGRVAGSPDPQFLITDLAGHPLDGFNFRTETGLPTPSEISVVTTGPQAGAFAVLDATAMELVVFRVR